MPPTVTKFSEMSLSSKSSEECVVSRPCFGSLQFSTLRRVSDSGDEPSLNVKKSSLLLPVERKCFLRPCSGTSSLVRFLQKPSPSNSKSNSLPDPISPSTLRPSSMPAVSFHFFCLVSLKFIIHDASFVMYSQDSSPYDSIHHRCRRPQPRLSIRLQVQVWYEEG